MHKTIVPCFTVPLEFDESTLKNWILRWYEQRKRPAGKYELVFEFMFYESYWHPTFREVAYKLQPEDLGYLSWEDAKFFATGPQISVVVHINE